MRRSSAWILIASAIGVVVIIQLTREDNPKPRVAEQPTDGNDAAAKDATGLKERSGTPTSLRENKALRELERTLQRKDLSRAYAFRQQVCEQMTEILKNEKLARNLLDAIKEHGLGNDPKRRALMLPILRVMNHPEATLLVEQAYFGAKNEEERLLMLEAMAHSYHDPKRAAVWTVDQALNGETKEQRYRAFNVLSEYSNDLPLVVDTAKQIYSQTTRHQQALQMINAIAGGAGSLEPAREWLRSQIPHAKGDRLGAMVQHMDIWGTERDAANLELLATEHPGMAEFLLERAKAIRDAIREKAGGEPIVDEAADRARAARMEKKERGDKPDDDTPDEKDG